MKYQIENIERLDFDLHSTEGIGKHFIRIDEWKGTERKGIQFKKERSKIKELTKKSRVTVVMDRKGFAEKCKNRQQQDWFWQLECEIFTPCLKDVLKVSS